MLAKYLSFRNWIYRFCIFEARSRSFGYLVCWSLMYHIGLEYYQRCPVKEVVLSYFLLVGTKVGDKLD